MKKLIVIILISVVCNAFYSCAPPPIDIKIPEAKHKLAIASQVIPGEIIAVSVTKSFSSLTGGGAIDSSIISNVLIPHANVTITVNGGQVIQLYSIVPGIYASANVLSTPGTNYELHVRDSASGMECSSSSVMLPQVLFDTIHPVVVKDSGDTTVFMDFDIIDPPQTTNYYLVNLYLPKSGSIVDLKSLIGLSSGAGTDNMILLSDKEFVNGRYHSRQAISANHNAVIAYTLSNISADYYKFLTTWKTSAKLFNQLTGEPINFPTNIKGGYGFFTTTNPDIRIFDLSKY